MNLFQLSARSLRENVLRNTLTVCAVAVSLTAFLLLRTITWAWNVAADSAAPDRIATRHKVTFVMPLPVRYFEEIKQAPGVKDATFLVWSDGRSPAHEKEFFAALAVHTPTFFSVYNEVKVPEDQKKAWLEDRQGALVGAVLAKKLGWKVGDRVKLTSGIYPDPGEWEFTVRGVYEATRKSIDQSGFFWHYNYLNDSVPENRRDYLGWVVARVTDPSRTAQISKQIDTLFDVRDTQTLTMSEGEMQKSFIGMAGALLKAIDVISMVLLGIMGLILGNTIAMGVRERTNQYAVMRAIGFLPKHVLWLVLGEGLVMGVVSGLCGLALAYPFINLGVGRFIEENMGSYFPYFRLTVENAGLAFGVAVLLGIGAAVLPARGAARLTLVDALRKVG
jgi:putative ABC transport system permease protein